MRLFLRLFIIFLAYPFVLIQAQNKKVLDSLNFAYQNAQYDTTKILLLTSIAFEYRNTKPDTCIAIAEKALTQSEQIIFAQGKARALRSKGSGYIAKGEYTKALNILQTASAIAEKIPNSQMLKASILNGVGITYYYQGNYPMVLEYYHKSLKITEDIGDKQGTAASLNNIGNIYNNQGNYSSALEYYHRSLKINEDIGNKQTTSSILNNIGLIYNTQGDYSLALEYFQKSLKASKEIDNKRDIAANLGNMGITYYYQGNYSSALEYYQKSLKIREEIADKRGIAANLGNIGMIYEHQGNYQLAFEYFQKSLKIREEIDDKYGINHSLVGIANVYQKQKDYKKSISYALKSLQISQEIKAPREIKNASEILYQTYKLEGNYVKALEYHELYKQTQDTLFNVDKSKAIANLESRFFLEKKEKELTLLLKDNEVNKLTAEKRTRELQITKKQAEADQLYAFARAEKDKRKQDSLYNLAQKRQLEADNLKAKEAQLQAENQARQAALAQEIKAKEIQQIITYLVLLGLLSMTVLAYFIYRSRQKEKSAKEKVLMLNEAINQQKEEISLMNRSLVSQAEKLAESNQTKDKLFAILGHDLRSPISSLEGALNLIDMGLLSYEEFQNFVPEFHKSVKNMQTTLENLLQWSISQMQGLSVNPSKVYIGKLIDEKVQLFAEVAKAKNITISTQIDATQIVWADAQHIRLLLRNLINNALKFTHKGGSIEIVTQAQGKYLVLSVIDSGVGMSAEQIDKLFKKNHSFTTYGTNGEKGTGLGLQLCQEIVVKNGGTIWVSSELGKGSNFSFTLPIAQIEG
ncbi:MAG: tetratricopeptide repeat protein [Microscillaceae bacterium]|jgi:signal transduction histidine kinase|nr:tetratricopeptide repeat protein [Microscillaceae bacterium]